jgi:hypothetical protein
MRKKKRRKYILKPGDIVLNLEETEDKKTGEILVKKNLYRIKETLNTYATLETYKGNPSGFLNFHDLILIARKIL